MKKLFYLLALFSGIAHAQIVNIPDANFKAALIAADVDTNADGNIQQSEAVSVFNSLNLNDSNITDLTGIEAFVNVTDLSCRFNSITNVDFLSSLNNLNIFDCAHNQIQQINFTTTHSFLFFDCSYNSITNISSLNTTTITEFLINNNLITDLDLSHILFTSSSLGNFTGNPVVRINAKNNFNENANFIDALGQNTTLKFVCADENEISQVNQHLTSQGMSDVVVNSYCTFTPGGNYNTITGTLTFDANNNGCDSNDVLQPNIKVNITDATSTGASFTNTTGNYTFYTLAGNFGITPSVENPTWFSFSPTSPAIPFANNNNNTVTQNFCIAANGIHSDVEVVIAPISGARPGFDSNYLVVYKNKGNQILSGNVAFSYDDAVLDFASSTITPSAQATGLLTFDYTNLLPFENRSFYITFNVNAPTDTPAVNIDDHLNFVAVVNPISGDENTSDNTFSYSQTVVGSFDPNDITCIEGNVVPPSEIGKYLHYSINFENTGTAQAENIVVRDEIDTTQFDVSSLQVLNSSDTVTAKLTGNVAEFIFPNINLHSGGHGNILIKVKSKNTLVQGNSVSKKAKIYFDYNFPIETLPESTVFQNLNAPGFNIDASILVYPNPSKEKVNVNCNTIIKSVQLYDVQGRLLQTNMVNENHTIFDISNQSNGIYFIKVTSDKGISVQKIVKE